MAVTYNSHPYGLITNTAPSNKLLRKSDGVFRFGPHNLYLNSAAPANQAITVVSGAPYSITITGTVSVTASGAAAATWTAGTSTFTAATGTLTLGSTSGAGTVHLRRTPSESLYLATGASPKYGLPFEWDASGNIIGIVREPAATNLIASQNFTTWTKVNAGTGLAPTVTGGFAGPDGELSAFEVTCNLGGSNTLSDQSNIGINVSVANATQYSGGCFVKGVAGEKILIRHVGGSPYTLLTFTGDWQLVRSTETSISTSAVFNVGLRGSLGATSPVTFQIWHAQLETGGAISSPIRTHGATATRAVDQISVAQTALPAIGTAYGMYFEGEYINNALNDPEFVEYSGATDSANIVINPSNVIRLFAADNSVTQADLASTLTATAGTTFRAAGAWKANDFRISANGGAVQTDNSGTLPTDFTSLILGNAGYMRIKKVAVFYRELSDAELISLSGTGALS